MVIANRILRRIFGSKSDKNGEWRRLHNEKVHNLYHSPYVVRVIKMIKACSQNGRIKECF
jgi:hypothetical protein